MPDLKSMSKMTVTVNGVERPMSEREKRWATLLFPFIARQVAREMRKQHPSADREKIADLMRADLGANPDPMELKLIDKVLDRLPPPAGTPRHALLTEAQSSPSAWVLALANLIPAWGVLMLGWDVFPLVLLFWLENVVIGILNVARMSCVDPADAATWLVKLFMVPFFCVHYGMFTAIHGVFVFALFGGDVFSHTGPSNILESVAQAVAELGLGWPVLVLAGSHLFSFLWNYLLRGEYKTAAVSELMMKPYGRVVTLHLGILGCGFLITLLGSPKWALLLMVALKTIFDVRAHLREHRADAGK